VFYAKELITKKRVQQALDCRFIPFGLRFVLLLVLVIPAFGVRADSPAAIASLPKNSALKQIEGRYLGETSTPHRVLIAEVRDGFLEIDSFKSFSQNIRCTDKDFGLFGLGRQRLGIDQNLNFSGRCIFGPGEGIASGRFPFLNFEPTANSNVWGFTITLVEDGKDSRHELRRQAAALASREIALTSASSITQDQGQSINSGLLTSPTQIPAQIRLAEDQSLAGVKRFAEAKPAEDARDKKLEQIQLAEATRVSEENRVSEDKRLAEERKLAEEKRLAEERKLADAKRAEDERKKLEQVQLAEAKRIAEERRMAEERKLAEEKRLAEEKKLAEAKRADQERAAKEAMQREQKLAAELREMKEQLQALQKNAPKPSVAVVGTRRLALVIGNDGYQSVPKLINARADARAMAKQLEATGFKVTLQFDLTERAMKDALRTFRSGVEGGDEVVMFFAGHGVQLGTANYLLPVDIRGDSEEQVKDEAIPLQRILDDLSDRKARFSLAIVDACRDNPFKTTGRSIGGRGLAPAAAASGQMVIFSAGTGQQALDRLGDKDKDPNGLFTRVFLKEMAKPGVPIDRVVRTVRNEVVQMAKSVGHEQVPALYDQTLGDFFFVR
jgi:hypothetical protein